MRDNNQLSINIFLTEEFLGKCWHKYTPMYKRAVCKKCGMKAVDIPNFTLDSHKDLFTPSGFFLLWEKAQKEEWWDKFYYEKLTTSIELDWRFIYQKFTLETINPLTFPTLLAEYLGWKEDTNE